MVQIVDRFCESCGHVTSHHDGRCTVCVDSRRRAEVAAWNELTVDQRLNDLRKRMEKLEGGEP